MDKPLATITRTGFTTIEIEINGLTKQFDFKSLSSTKEFTRKAWKTLNQKYGVENVEFVGL